MVRYQIGKESADSDRRMEFSEGGSSGWKTLRGAVGKKRSGGKDNLLAGLSDITGSSRQLSSRRWSGEGAE